MSIILEKSLQGDWAVMPLRKYIEIYLNLHAIL